MSCAVLGSCTSPLFRADPKRSQLYQELTATQMRIGAAQAAATRTTRFGSRRSRQRANKTGSVSGGMRNSASDRITTAHPRAAPPQSMSRALPVRSNRASAQKARRRPRVAGAASNATWAYGHRMVAKPNRSAAMTAVRLRNPRIERTSAATSTHRAADTGSMSDVRKPSRLVGTPWVTVFGIRVNGSMSNGSPRSWWA